MAEERTIMRLFVSQPMADRSDEEIFEERWDALRRVQAARPEVHVALIPSFISETTEGVKPPLWYLGYSLQMLSEADLIFMAPGWSESRGCSLERLAAERYGIEVAYWEDYAEEEEE